VPKALSDDQVVIALKSLPRWSHENDRLNREYKFADFSEALGFIVRVGLLAEQHNHHPELFNVYSTVRVALNTHDAGGKVTGKDVELAKAIDALDT